VIEPGGIPTIPGDMEALAGHAAALRGVGSDFATTGQRINTTWQGLRGVYYAPEAGQLLAAIAPVQAISASVGEDIGTLAGALVSYADEVRRIQDQLVSLRSQAGEFITSVAGDDDWTSDGDKVDRNNQLISAVNAQMAAFFDAQRRCANTINALYGGQQYRVDNGDGQLSRGEYGYPTDYLGAAAGQDKALPWGKSEEKDRGLLGDVGAFFGGIKDGAVGFVTGLGALIGRDPTTGQWSWSTAGTAWKGLGTLVLAAGVYAVPGGMQLDQTIGLPGLGHGALGEILTNAGKSIIAYDEWGKDPARAAGTATFNIISAVVGTKGAGAGLRAVGTAARGSRVAAVSTAGTVMVRSGEAIGKLPTVSDLAKSAAQRVPGLHLPDLARTAHINIPHHTDIPGPRAHVDLPTSHPHLHVPDAIPRPGSVGDALSRTPHAHFDTPASTPPAAVPGQHPDSPTPHPDVAGHHTDVPTQRAADATPVPAHVSGHTDPPAEAHASGPPSAVHHDPASPAPTHAAHDTSDHSPDAHGHAADAPGAHHHNGPDHPLDAPIAEGNWGAQPDGSWIGAERGTTFTLDPAANRAADQFLASSASAEHHISPQITAIAGKIDGARMQGYPDYVLKSEDSLKRKLATDLIKEPNLRPADAIAELNDSVRYTLEIPPHYYADGVVRAVHEMRAHGFENVAWKPCWEDPGAYKGLNSTWRDPATGQLFELQFHTSESFSAKMTTHELYEAQRLPGVSDAEILRLKQQQAHTFRHVDAPPGVERVNELTRIFEFPPSMARFDDIPVAPHHDFGDGPTGHLGAEGVDAVPVEGLNHHTDWSHLSTITDSVHEPAIHYDSVDRNDAHKYIVDRHPYLLETNMDRWLSRKPGHDINCTHCVVSVERQLNGIAVEAAPRFDLANVWEDLLNELPKGTWHDSQTYDNLIRSVEQAGPNSRGVVYIARPGDGGAHVFNVVNTEDGVVFLDGQKGSLGALEPNVTQVWLYLYK
jgi:hypothetical protein